MSDPITRRLVVRGRVQGVGYRWSMRREALSLGLAGWVRNRADGSVEAVVQGSAQAVEAITRWARSGPPEAGVTALEAEAAEGRFEGFETRPTA